MWRIINNIIIYINLIYGSTINKCSFCFSCVMVVIYILNSHIHLFTSLFDYLSFSLSLSISTISVQPKKRNKKKNNENQLSQNAQYTFFTNKYTQNVVLDPRVYTLPIHIRNRACMKYVNPSIYANRSSNKHHMCVYMYKCYQLLHNKWGLYGARREKAKKKSTFQE